jgi:hypothetical protein
MSNWKWANEPKPGRLRVEETSPGTVRFWDTQTDEWVKVVSGDDPQATVMHIGREMPETPVVLTLDIDYAKHFVIGEGIARRQVYHFVNRDRAIALRAGLTIHESAFSSTPHEFEKSPEAGFEEAFYFLLPSGGKGILECDGIWPDGTAVDAAYPVRHQQLAQVPMGWHRVVALPDKDGVPPPLAYCWCYICDRPEWEKD